MSRGKAEPDQEARLRATFHMFYIEQVSVQLVTLDEPLRRELVFG